MLRPASFRLPRRIRNSQETRLRSFKSGNMLEYQAQSVSGDAPAMLIRSGKNWVFDLFRRRGWLDKRRRTRQRDGSASRLSIVPAECQRLEDRTLLSTITVTSLA